jgi:hypothetical protein
VEETPAEWAARTRRAQSLDDIVTDAVVLDRVARLVAPVGDEQGGVEAVVPRGRVRKDRQGAQQGGDDVTTAVVREARPGRP